MTNPRLPAPPPPTGRVRGPAAQTLARDDAQPLRPVVGDRREVRVDPYPQLRDRVRQRVVEVAVATVAEAMARHVDRAAEATTVEQCVERVALIGVEQRRRDRVACVVELGTQRVTVQGVDFVHVLKTTQSPDL